MRGFQILFEAWITKRRKEVRVLAGNVDPEDCEPEPCEATWTAQHEKELKFVRGKHVRNLAEAIQNGTFLDADASDGELVKVATYMDKKRKTDANYVKGKQRQAERNTDTGRRSLENQRIYFDGGTDGLEEMRSVMQRQNMTRADTLHDADVFVVPDMQNTATHILWEASLIGGVVTTYNFLRFGSGPSWVFKPALRARRFIWFTRQFLRRHQQYAEAIAHRMGSYPSCAWRYAEAEADFRARAALRTNLTCMVFIAAPREREAGSQFVVHGL